MLAAVAISPEFGFDAEYDGRRTSAMTKERKALDSLLSRWAVCWMTAFNSLGYPKASVYTRIGELGTRVSNEFATIQQMPDDLMQVDKAILQLRPIRRTVIVHRYVYFITLEHAARSCNMSVGRYRTMLTSACDTLEDLLKDLIAEATRNSYA